MRRGSTILILLLSSLSLSGQTKDSIRFKISIIQGGREYLINNNVISLKRQPFSFAITMNNHVDLCVNASFDSSTYFQARKGLASKNLKGFQDSDAMAVILKNEEKDIGITKEGYNVWFYENDSIHTFREIERKVDTIVCWIQIDKLTIVSYPKYGPEIVEVPLEKVKTDLFLVFVDRVYRKHPNKNHWYNSNDLVDVHKVTCKVVWE